MLTEIRSRATGWIAWIIVIIITIPFALWGINSYFQGAAAAPVATVNGSEIEYNTFQRSLSERRRVLAQSLGGNFSPDILSSPEFKRESLNEMITDLLVSQYVQENRFRVGDSQLAEEIQQTPSFQSDGKFDPSLYENSLQRFGYSKAEYETQLRRSSAVRQIMEGFSESAFVTDRDTQTTLRLLQQKRDAQYVTINSSRFRESVSVADEEISKEFEKNQQDYRTESRLRVEYIELSVDSLAKNIEPSEQELRRKYEQNAERYRSLERRRASHILITLPPEADDDQERTALETVESLLEQARGGADFGELAREHSQDPGSASKGGDLGVIEVGVMVPEFERAAYTLSADEISDPVRTQFGYHIIKLTELVPPEVKSFETVRDEIRDEERRRQAGLQFIDLAETLRNLVYEQDESLEPAAEELELEVKTSGWFSRSGGDGIAQHEAVIEAAFSDDVLLEGLNSEAVEIDINSIIALRKLDYEDSRVPPLEQVKDEVESVLSGRKSRAEAQNLQQDILQRLESGENWSVIAEEFDLTPQDLPETRTGGTTPVERQVLEQVFRAPRPQAGHPSFGTVESGSDEFVVYALFAVEEGDPDDYDQQARENVIQALTQRRGLDYYLSFQKGLWDRADIQVFEERL
ncbi:MAG: SurA N-terminal domain-containing protein [Gammaproteobacteria bacterium]|nr:SurA N-terminal domain-containing protein [Gammaproteobacteria bacterium]